MSDYMVYKEDYLERSLILWEEVDSLVPTQFKSWEEHVEELCLRTIHQYPHPDYVEEMHKKIDEIYSRNFTYFEGAPDFGDVMQDVNDYNDELVYRMAEIQYDNVGYESDEELSRDEGIEAVKTMLYDFNDFDMFYNIDKYVYQYLINRGLFFLIPDSYYTHEKLFGGEDVIVTVNDCQNILFPEFLHEIQEEVSPYYPGGSPTLIVWGG